MRIRAFHIDAFGILRNVTVEGLPAGFAIFLGRNEAGKSTLLDFFRCTLAGYPVRPKEEREKAYLTGNAGQIGGSLTLDTEQGRVRLTRRPGVAGGVPTLTDAVGNPLDAALWDRLFGGITREIYTSIYGFSLTELQSFSSLNSEDVRNALYGASFGMGLRSPGAALKRLDTEMGMLFKPKGSNQQLSLALRTWEEVRKSIRSAEAEAAQYDTQAAEHELRQKELSDLREERNVLERERRELERRLSVWRQWEEWRLTGVRLDRLEAVPATFPQDGPVRLERALERREAAAREVRLNRERLEQSRQEMEACQVNEPLLAAEGELRELAERKSSCRNALVAIPGLRISQDRIIADTQRELETLGESWTLEQVVNMPRSLALREDIERQATEIQVADTAYAALETHLGKISGELEEARHRLDAARERCETLPVPAADLDNTARERLGEYLARTEEARRRLPEREKALAVARGEFSRALNHLHLRPRQNTARTLEELSNIQEEALRQSQDILRRLSAEEEAKRLAAQARDNESQARERFEHLQDQRDDLGDPDRAVLDDRRTALRRLRAIVTQLAAEESRLAEAEEQYQAHAADAPGAERSIPLISVGVLFAVVGSLELVARQFWGITQWELAPDRIIPLELWLGYLVLLAGVAFIWAGLPRRRPEAERHAAVEKQLRARQETLAAKVREFKEEISRLCGALRITSVDGTVLDALEGELDREREQCVAGERLQQELQVHERDLSGLHHRAVQLETELARRTAEVQLARRQWHERLIESGVQSVPSAENASAFFARVDNARVLWHSVETLEKEVTEMEQRENSLVSVARELLPETAWPESWNVLPQVLDAVRRVLESCRQADLAAEERARAVEALRGAEAGVERLEHACREAGESLERARERRETAYGAWRESMRAMGLAEQFSPVTAREALECMERIRNLEKEQRRLQDALQRQERERDALVKPFRALLRRLECPCPVEGPEEGVALLECLGGLQRELDAQHRLEGERERLVSRLAEQEGLMRQAEALLEDAQRQVDWLLHMADAEDAEAFLRKWAIRTERETLQRRREDLEDALRLAAEDMAKGAPVEFENFLTSFAGLEQGDLEDRLNGISGRLVFLAEEDARLADTVRTLAIRLENLAASHTLSELRVREAECAEEIRSLAQKWGRYAVARHLLVEARKRFERERQPEVIRRASVLFTSITGDKWSGISASLEDSSLRVLTPHGEPVSPEVLSRGAQEQLYLALRLAHVQNHAAQALPLPVIMDDVLVNFDPERVDRTAFALAGLTDTEGDTPGHQILFFTCHPHIAHRLQEIVPGSVLYTMEHGTVAVAGQNG